MAKGNIALSNTINVTISNAPKGLGNYNTNSTYLFTNEKPLNLRDLGAFCVVEVTGFEPAAFWSRTKRATKLRYASNGANVGIRTPDLRITSAPLYLLSHIGTADSS